MRPCLLVLIAVTGCQSGTLDGRWECNMVGGIASQTAGDSKLEMWLNLKPRQPSLTVTVHGHELDLEGRKLRSYGDPRSFHSAHHMIRIDEAGAITWMTALSKDATREISGGGVALSGDSEGGTARDLDAEDPAITITHGTAADIGRCRKVEQVLPQAPM